MQAPLFIDDSPGLSPTTLRAKARRLKQKHDIQLIVIDYLQLMEGGAGKKTDSRQEEISYISRSLKMLARELRVPIIAISQLNRAAETREDHKPRLRTCAVGRHRAGRRPHLLPLPQALLHEGRERPRGLAEIIVAKQRNGPRTGAARLPRSVHAVRQPALRLRTAALNGPAAGPSDVAGGPGRGGRWGTRGPRAAGGGAGFSRNLGRRRGPRRATCGRVSLVG
jgi:hypothetical protein